MSGSHRRAGEQAVEGAPVKVAPTKHHGPDSRGVPDVDQRVGIQQHQIRKPPHLNGAQGVGGPQGAPGKLLALLV